MFKVSLGAVRCIMTINVGLQSACFIFIEYPKILFLLLKEVADIRRRTDGRNKFKTGVTTERYQ